MSGPMNMVEVRRGPFVECVHAGHAVVCDRAGQVVAAWGDPDLLLLPRSSAKPFQALPLIESGAADAAGLGPAELALACASHIGAPVHTRAVVAWLDRIGLADEALHCGVEPPRMAADRQALRDTGERANQVHNNCSGKHTGFLTLSRYLGAGPEYIDPAHPVQLAVREAFEDMTDAASPGFGIDGCSAPNFATTLTGLARAAARLASARDAGGARERALCRLRMAMAAHPDLVAGEGKACTRLMRLMGGQGVVKTGAEGVYIAALPALGLGVALKIVDGATRGSEVAITALLAHLGAFPDGADIADLLNPPVTNRRGILVGGLGPVAGFPA